MSLLHVLGLIKCGHFDCFKNCCGDPAFLDKLSLLFNLTPEHRATALDALCDRCSVRTPVETSPWPPIGSAPGTGSGGQQPPDPGQPTPGPVPNGDLLRRFREVACAANARRIYAAVRGAIAIARSSVSAEWRIRLDALDSFIAGLENFCADEGASVASISAICEGYKNVRDFIRDAINVPGLGFMAELLRAVFGQELGRILDQLCELE